MFTFLIGLAVLVLSYFVYGRLVERLFGPDNRPTPVQLHEDGVDFIRMPRWKIFMIQFLNIAGTGPIFGAIMGAKFGTSCFLWIVFGCIFIGAVHDYLVAMISLRHNGESLPELVGRYLGGGTRQVMRVFTLVLLILVGAVFIDSPAEILDHLTGGRLGLIIWMAIIFGYYLCAAVLPIDKIIGKIYPIFAFAILFMAVGLLIAFLFHAPGTCPEIWDGLQNNQPNPEAKPIFPMLFITVACGAISGFHATQNPMMCRCMQSEHQGRGIFFGAMITEGIVALIWAAAASWLFHTQPDQAAETAPKLVFFISGEWLGVVGGALAILGVVFAPISTGDTALRSARLIVADIFKIDQSALGKRLGVAIVIFAITFGVLFMRSVYADGFDALWRYFAWANQTLSVFTLWAITVYLASHGKWFVVTLLPALFMTTICTSYICVAPEGFGLSLSVATAIGCSLATLSLVWFIMWWRRQICHM